MIGGKAGLTSAELAPIGMPYLQTVKFTDQEAIGLIHLTAMLAAEIGENRKLPAASLAARKPVRPQANLCVEAIPQYPADTQPRKCSMSRRRHRIFSE